MVLESLIGPVKAEKEPWEMFFIGILYSSVAVFLSLYVFGGQEMSLVLVFLTVMACSILMYQTLRYEEKKDLYIDKEYKLLEQHGKALSFFIFLFVGFVLSFALWYVFLPGDLAQRVFNSQINTINDINSLTIHGKTLGAASFWIILLNNFKVAFFSLFFSFFYGFGAIFILTWNASVVGVATGIFIRNSLNVALQKAGFVSITSYFTSISVGLLRYLTHGIPEIASYFVAGLAGGLISIAVMHHGNNTDEFKRVMKDCMWLVLVCFVLLVVAAVIEVWITPWLIKY